MTLVCVDLCGFYSGWLLAPGRGFGLVVLICCFDCRLLELVVCGCVCVFCGLIAGCGLSWRGFGCGLRCLVWRFECWCFDF